jgi:hypothetical protein
MLECSDSCIISSVNPDTVSRHSTDDIAVVDVLVYGDDDDDNQAEATSAESFLCKDMSNYKGLRKQFMDKSEPKGAATDVQEIVLNTELFFNREFIKNMAEETNRYAIQFQNSRYVCMMINSSCLETSSS